MGRASILVVDDDLDMRTTLCEVLADEGYQVAAAANGAEAMSYLRLRAEESPALILLDLMMPVMNGWEMCEALRSDPALASVPVLVLSADPAATTDPAARGQNGALKKPVDLEELLAQVGRYCLPETRS